MATLPSGSRIYKTTATGFVDVTAKAAISGSAVTLTLTDGDAVDDADGAKDGVITDPVGVATPQATPGAPGVATAASGGGGGGGGGCQLGGEAAPGAEWALLALGALAVRFRSRRSQ